MKKSPHRFLFFLILPLLIASGCGAKTGRTEIREDAASRRIGILLKSMNSQHWMDIRSGAIDAARECGVDAVILYPSDETAAEEQTAMFHDLVDAAPDAIILAPCDSSNCAPLAELAAGRDIPLLALDTRATDVSLPYVGADNRTIGRLAAQRMAELLGDTGTLAIISGVKEQASHQERIAGFEEELAMHPGLKVVAVRNADSDFRLAMQRTKEVLEAEPDVGGIFCTSAVMGLGVIEQAKGMQTGAGPRIVAVDTQDDALNALQLGLLDGLVTQEGYEAGYLAVRQAVAMLDDAAVPADTFIHSQLLTRDNIDDYLAQRRKNGDVQP